MDQLPNPDVEEPLPKRQQLRIKADRASAKRCTSVIAVLEQPMQHGNVGAVVRNIDALGVGKLYVITGRKMDSGAVHHASVGSSKYVYVKCFESTEACVKHLADQYAESWATSPHKQGMRNVELSQMNFTKAKRIALWFGNESDGLSEAALQACVGCIQIEMCGITESLNLAVSTAIVLYEATRQRRNQPPPKKSMEKWRRAQRREEQLLAANEVKVQP